MAKIEAAADDVGWCGLIDGYLPHSGKDQDAIIGRCLKQLTATYCDWPKMASKILNPGKA